MYDTLRTVSCIIRVFYFLYCFLLFICVRLTRDLINATYLISSCAWCARRACAVDCCPWRGSGCGGTTTPRCVANTVSGVRRRVVIGAISCLVYCQPTAVLLAAQRPPAAGDDDQQVCISISIISIIISIFIFLLLRCISMHCWSTVWVKQWVFNFFTVWEFSVIFHSLSLLLFISTAGNKICSVISNCR